MLRWEMDAEKEDSLSGTLIPNRRGGASTAVTGTWTQRSHSNKGEMTRRGELLCDSFSIVLVLLEYGVLAINLVVQGCPDGI